MTKTGLVLLGMCLTTGADVGAFAAEPSAEAHQTEGVAIDVVQPPKIIRWAMGNLYPQDEIDDGREGWVVMTIMVDATGKPVGAMINDSSGNPAFERAALKSVDKMAFEPARRNGSAVDGSFWFKLTFAADSLAKAATPAFISAYRKFMKSIEARDKPASDEQLARLKPRNLHEEALANFGKYYYHVAWGTQRQQVEDLTAAIANESKPTYLPKDLFVTALYMKFKLEIATSDFGAALDTWGVLEPLAEADMRQKVQKVVDEIHTLQAGNQPTRLHAVINDPGRWGTSMLRNRFNIVVKDGSIDEVHLNCAQKSMSFKFDPAMEYTVGAAKDHCRVTLTGKPGSTFDFNQ